MSYALRYRALRAGEKYVNNKAAGAVFVVKIKNAGEDTSLTFTVTGHADNLDDTGYTILASTAKTANGSFQLNVHPAITAANNVSASTILPRFFSVKQTGTADGATAEISMLHVP